MARFQISRILDFGPIRHDLTFCWDADVRPKSKSGSSSDLKNFGYKTWSKRHDNSATSAVVVLRMSPKKYVWPSHIAKVRINRVGLPILVVVS